MSDLTMAKVKALYEDMVAMENNVRRTATAMERKLDILEKQARHNHLVDGRAVSSWKAIVTTAAIAFGIGVSLAPGFRYSSLLACIPLALGIAWALLTYFESRPSSASTGLPQSEQTTHQETGKNTGGKQPSIEVIQDACRALKLSASYTLACSDVLVDGISVEKAAEKYGIWTTSLEKKIDDVKAKIYC